MKPKDKGGLIAVAFGSPRKPSADEESAEGEAPSSTDAPMTSGDASFNAFARAAGIPPESWGKAKEALGRYVRACTQDSDDNGV